MRVKSGSAMVITLLLLTTVGSITFAIGRLFILDLTMSRIRDDSVVAYYAAESGVEEGLLRYRFNKNEQIEAGDESKAVRSNLENLSSSAGINITATGTIPSAADRVYDLRMYFLEKDLCRDDLGNDDGTCDKTDKNEYISIGANESMKFDLTETKKNDYDLYIMPETDGEAVAFEAKIIGNKTSLATEPVEYKNMYLSSTILNATGISTPKTVATFDVPNRYKVDSIFGDIVGANPIDEGDFSDESKRVELIIKPLSISYGGNSSGNIKVMLVRTIPDPAAQIAGEYSTIKSVGHYGDVTRTLVAKIDRQSGTLYDVFDFVLYQY